MRALAVLLVILTISVTSAHVLPIVKWKTHLSGLVDSAPAYYGGRIFVTNWYGWGEWEPGLYCINASNGEIVWRNGVISGASTAAINESGDMLFVGSLSGKIYAVNVSDGKIVWSKKLEKNPQWWGIASSPLVHNGRVYVLTFSDSTLHALNFSGYELWNFTAGGETSKYTSPAAKGERIFFAGTEGGKSKLYCLNEDGELEWSAELVGNATSSPSISSAIYISTDKALNAVSFNGSLLWTVELEGTISTPVVYNGRIYVGGKKALHCISENGSELWKFEVDGKIDSTPAVSDNTVYFATNTPEGTVYAINASTGEMLWMYRLKPPSGHYYNIMSSPVLHDGRLFIGTDSGDVFCFSSEGEMRGNVTVKPGSVEVDGKVVDNSTPLGAVITASRGCEVMSSEVAFNLKLDGGLEEIMGVRCNWSLRDDGYNGYVVAECHKPSVTLNFSVRYEEISISILNVTEAERGGFATLWVRTVGDGEGWKVVVVSGTNAEGDSLAGISVFEWRESVMTLPVLVAIPQKVSGKFRLYAGLYNFSEFPVKLLAVSNGVEVEVE